MTAIIFLLLIGLIVALVRASDAARRSRALEERISAHEARLASLEGRAATNLPRERAADRPTGAGVPTPAVPPPPIAPAAAPADPPRLPGAPVFPADPPRLPGASASPGDVSEPGRLEELIGGRWLLFAGLAAIVLGISYFVKFAFDNGWISEPARVAAGVCVGSLLVAAGVRFRSRGVGLFGASLAGAGIVVLYVSIYAARHFYALLSSATAFTAMGIVTAGAAFLADRERSQPLAALALVGGFATPLLVGGDRHAQVVLFTYMAMLIGGASAISRRHAWPLLGAASYACTFVLVLLWLVASGAERHWLRTELYLTAYAAMFGYMLAVALGSSTRSWQVQLGASVLATAPLTYHLASVALLTPHPAAWLLYVILATLTGLVVVHRLKADVLRVFVLLAIGVPMLAWITTLEDSRWSTATLVAVIAMYGLHLASQWEAVGSRSRSAVIVNIVHTQMNGLVLPLTLYVFFADRAAWFNPWMTAAAAAWHAGLAWIARSRAPWMALQFVALSATLAAIAVVLAFDGSPVAAGWTAEGVVVGWLAVRERSRTLAVGSCAFVGLGAMQLFSLLAAPLPVGETPVLNPRALASALVIAMVAWLARRVRAEAHPLSRHARTALLLLANVLALAWASADLHAFFVQRGLDASLGDEPRGATDAKRAEQVALSVTWALYAVALVFVGIRRRFAAGRYFAIALFGLVILKVLAVDIAGLDRLSRMLSVLAVGLLLLVASYLYQRRGGVRS